MTNLSIIAVNTELCKYNLHPMNSNPSFVFQQIDHIQALPFIMDIYSV